MEKTLLVGITGASGAIYAFFLLQKLKELQVPSEVIITSAGKMVWQHEIEKPWEIIKDYALKVYQEEEISAPPASGSSEYWGMVIIPCSMGTLAGLATGQARNLLLRAGDVMLKERKPLLLVVRETPLNYIHLQNMLTITTAGGIIFPAMPGFYTKPKSLEELVENFVHRILQFLNLSSNPKAWRGL